jgi:hypothetical protein
MIWQISGAAGCVLLMASAAAAQTKISGTVQCAKLDQVASADVGDRPGHTITLNKGTCTWTTPMEIEGAKTKDDAIVIATEATATRMTSNGAVVNTLDNGDKIFVSIHDSAPVKDGKPGDGHGTFMFTGGTGKAKGIRGKGTYTLVFGPDGTATSQAEGEYQMPVAKAAGSQ